MLLGGVAGGLVGATAAIAISSVTWDLAFHGECSCTDVTQILIYAKPQFVARAALVGAGLGVLMGAVAGIGAGPAAGTAIVGMLMTYPGIKESWHRLEKSNFNDKCAWVSLVANSIGFGASAYGGLAALSKGLTTGNWIDPWVTTPKLGVLPQPTGKEAFLSVMRGSTKYADTMSELLVQGRDLYTYQDWQSSGLSNVDATIFELFPQAFEESMNSVSRIDFDITALDTQRAWITGNVSTEQLIASGGKNVTAWEYYQIMTHPEWLAKTTFFKWENGVLKWFTAQQSGEIIPKVPPLQ